MSNKSTKKSPVIEFALLTVQERWEWIILAISEARFNLFLFCNKPEKKIYGVRTLTAEHSPSPHTSQYAFSWTISHHSVCTCFMDNLFKFLNILSISNSVSLMFSKSWFICGRVGILAMISKSGIKNFMVFNKTNQTNYKNQFGL